MAQISASRPPNRQVFQVFVEARRRLVGGKAGRKPQERLIFRKGELAGCL
jgi:hypothetical protein